MLRTVKSAGNLRQAVSFQQQQQRRNLASTILIGSKTEWEKMTVRDLKLEAKQRGIRVSSKARKADIVSSIAKDDYAKNSTSPNESPLSTTKTVSAPVTTEVVSPAGMETIPSLEESSPPAGSETPGKPIGAVGAEQIKSKAHLSVKIPTIKDEPVQAVPIPVLADNFRPSKPLDEPSSSPKVVTMASPSTHAGGGPSHATHATFDSHTIDIKEAAEEAASSGTSVVSSTVSAIVNPVVGFFSQEATPAKAFSKEDAQRPLKGDETTGLIAVAGVVSAWLAFGGLVIGAKKETKELVEEAHHA